MKSNHEEIIILKLNHDLFILKLSLEIFLKLNHEKIVVFKLKHEEIIKFNDEQFILKSNLKEITRVDHHKSILDTISKSCTVRMVSWIQCQRPYKKHNKVSNGRFLDRMLSTK